MDKKKPSVKKIAIYVDVEDDLTSIISKVRNSNGKIVALVPPRRVGVLQSAVNLKLLKKVADSEKKDIILISTDKTLGALAASAKIPVAKNLTTDAKLLDLPEDEESEEVITGLDQSIGDLDKKSKKQTEDKEVTAAVEAISDDDKIDINADEEDPKPKKSKKSKIPDFKKFRKWLVLIIIAGVGLIAFLIWLIFFSTSATITISAQTSDEKIDQAVNLLIDGQTDANNFQIKMVPVEPVKKTNQIEFKATGSKDIGEQATGTVTISNCEYNDRSISLVAGTIVYSGNLQYALNQGVEVPKAEGTLSTGCTKAGVSPAVGVTAVNVGPDYNIASGTKLSVSGYGGNFVATSTAISGGSKETITVVQQSDIDQIADKIKNDTGSASARAELSGRFTDNVMAIEDSFLVEFGDIHSNPAVGERATTATATAEVTYTMHGVLRDDLSQILMTSALSKLSNKNNQTVFDNGYSAVQLLSYNKGENNTATMRLTTTAKIGPKIDEEQIKNDAVGKKANEISSSIKKIDGVEEVTVDFFPFWVTVAPEADRIHIVKSGL